MEKQLLNEFKDLYKETKNLIDAFPADKRERVLFDEWTLKDVIAHLNHWAIHDLNCFNALKENKEPYWEPNTDEYNKQGVLLRREKSWEQIYEEFTDLIPKVISEFESLSEDLWNKKFWHDRRYTPKTFLEIDIDHYKNEHIPELRKNLGY